MHNKNLLSKNIFHEKLLHEKASLNRCDFTPFIRKSFQIGDPFLPLLSPKNSKSHRDLDIQLLEVGAKRHLNGISKVNRRTDTRTDKQIDLQKALAQWADALKILHTGDKASLDRWG